MEHAKFDALTKTVGRIGSRRTLLGGLAAGMLGAVMVADVAAKGGKRAEDGKGKHPKGKKGKQGVRPSVIETCVFGGQCDPGFCCKVDETSPVGAGRCLPNTDQVCGGASSDGQCVTCPAGTRCVNGGCLCDATTCPNGCCNGSTCVACPNGCCIFGQCLACSAGTRCVDGKCVCDATSCPNGSCSVFFGSDDAVCVPNGTAAGGGATICGVNGVNCNPFNECVCFGCCTADGACSHFNDNANCGTSGLCQACPAPGTCDENGVCSTCNAGNCANGCCQNGVCTTPSNDACGLNGFICRPCPTGFHCELSGSEAGTCVATPPCDASICPDGCCDANGNCLAGTNNDACGTDGAACAACGDDEQCANGACQTTNCGPANCSFGCCLDNVCRKGESDQVCGDLGAACEQCGAGEACQGGECVPVGGSCQPGFTLCNNVCVNLQRNKHNCGSCGHKCQGAKPRCRGGKCHRS